MGQFLQELEDWITWPFNQKLPLLHVAGLLVVAIVIAFFLTDSLRLLKKGIS